MTRPRFRPRSDPHSSSDDTDGVAVPDAAVKFVVQLCASNVELAHLSNVCRHWRRIVHEALWDAVTGIETDVTDTNDEASAASAPPRQGQQVPPPPPVASLLLPSMMRQVLRLRRLGDGDFGGHTGTQGSPNGKMNEDDDETYCLAWFAPEGIRTIRLDGEKERSSPRHDADSEEQSISRDIRQRPESLQPRDGGGERQSSTSSSSTSSSTSSVLLCPEWRGYRDAHEVLRPFGYSDSFVSSALQPCCDGPRTMKNGYHRDAELRGCTNEPIQSEIFGEKGAAIAPRVDVPYHQPSAAVRGATLARPDGYCCCMDIPSDNLKGEGHQLLRQAVPRVLLRSSTCQAKAVQFLNSTMAHAVCMVTPPFPAPQTMPITVLLVGIATEDGCFVAGLRRRSLELGHLYPRTSSESDAAWSAVCAASTCLPQQCRWGENGGPCDDAMTRHSASSLPYGFSSSDDGIDSGSTSRDDDDDEDNNNVGENGTSDKAGGCGGDGSRPSSSQDGNRRCSCPFAAVSGKFDDRATDYGDDGDDENDEKDDDASESRRNEVTTIHRGVTGPGQWRQYTAIFDGAEGSLIRVDGIPEPMDVQEPKPMELSSRQSHGRQPVSVPTQPVLDGLTIGSDHCFGMSLCCGYGSGGEGQGAIAELVILKGRLDEADLEALESHLMRKHGISFPMRASAEDRHRDAEWTRQSHLLYNRSISAAARNRVGTSRPEAPSSGVPLRIMARHPSVAWHQIHPVTGTELRTNKIGNRPNEDWSSSGGW
jgi:hypothetical protein